MKLSFQSISIVKYFVVKMAGTVSMMSGKDFLFRILLTTEENGTKLILRNWRVINLAMS